MKICKLLIVCAALSFTMQPASAWYNGYGYYQPYGGYAYGYGYQPYGFGGYGYGYDYQPYGFGGYGYDGGDMLGGLMGGLVGGVVAGAMVGAAAQPYAPSYYASRPARLSRHGCPRGYYLASDYVCYPR